MNPNTISRENSSSEYSARFPTTDLSQLEPLESILHELLTNVLKKGFYGTAGISITINDGVIQHVRSQTDQIQKYEKTGGKTRM